MSLVQQLLSARSSRAFWQTAVRPHAGALGDRAARPLPPAALRRAGFRRRPRRSARSRLPLRPRVVRAALSSSASRCSAGSWQRGVDAGAAPGHRAVARPRRGDDGRRARRATSIRRSSACRSRCDGMVDGRGTSSPATAGAVPLHPTGTNGEFVAGVRYRAWQPPSALHPTIGIHAPLVFDIDRHVERSLDRRLHLSRLASRRARRRHVPGQQLRGREPADGPLPSRSATRPGAQPAPAVRVQSRVPVHARPQAVSAPELSFDPDRRFPGMALALLGFERHGQLRRALRSRPASRAHDWGPLVTQLRTLGLEELRRRWEEARRLLHEHGVSYDVHGDRDGAARPWNLSPIPVVFGPDTWTPLTAGLSQRARLLDRVLADIYGPQKLVAEGRLPPELLFGHPGFLRPCVGIVAAAGAVSPLYSADVVRGRDGRFSVLADRPQAPSGVGYALENRIVLSRLLPEVFPRLRRPAPRRVLPDDAEPAPRDRAARAGQPAHRAAHAGALQLDVLRAGVPCAVSRAHAGPRRGPRRRDARVYLRTLGGLKKVDVILRRVNDDFCDPLELRPESFLGVPGLVEAVRAGEVAVVNPLGSGVAQTEALLPFLPAICRRVLDEELELPSVPTYWCGDAESLLLVESRLAQLVIKPAFPLGPSEPIFGDQLASGELAELRARIRANPRRYVAQERVDLSVVPSLAGDELSPGRFWMRTYAVASDHGYEVMPGALSRVGGLAERFVLSLEPGGESKDTWVLARGPVQPLSLLPPPARPSSSRATIATCPAGSPTTFSGSAATSSAPRVRRGSCGPSPCACRTPTARAIPTWRPTSIRSCACWRRRPTCDGSSKSTPTRDVPGPHGRSTRSHGF